MGKARIVKSQGEKVPMEMPAPKQQMDMSRRTIDEQLSIIKSPVYAKNGDMMRVFEQVCDNLTKMIIEKEDRIIQLTAENRRLSEDLSKARPKK